jgi:hypothetical protein
MSTGIVFHVGMNKTGTASLGAMMKENDPWLARAGFKFLTSLCGNAKIAHYSLFVAMLDAQHSRFMRTPIKAPWQIFFRKLSMNRKDRVQKRSRADPFWMSPIEDMVGEVWESTAIVLVDERLSVSIGQKSQPTS